MIRLLSLALAVEVVQTYSDGRLDVQGLFVETLLAPSLPTSAPKLALVCRLEWDGTEEAKTYMGRVEAIGPDGSVADRLDVKVEAYPTVAVGRMNEVLVLDGFPFKEYGTHRFRMIIGDDDASCPFQVLPASEA